MRSERSVIAKWIGKIEKRTVDVFLESSFTYLPYEYDIFIHESVSRDSFSFGWDYHTIQTKIFKRYFHDETTVSQRICVIQGVFDRMQFVLIFAQATRKVIVIVWSIVGFKYLFGIYNLN